MGVTAALTHHVASNFVDLVCHSPQREQLYQSHHIGERQGPPPSCERQGGPSTTVGVGHRGNLGANNDGSKGDGQRAGERKNGRRRVGRGGGRRRHKNLTDGPYRW
jgi:hypothetical protein